MSIPTAGPSQLATSIMAIVGDSGPAASASKAEGAGQPSISFAARLDVENAKAFFEDVQRRKVTFENAEDYSKAFKKFLEPSKSPPTAAEREAWETAGETLVEDYRRSREDYEQLTQEVMDKCQDIFKQKSAKGILHQDPTGRAKEVKSLQDKIQKETPGLMSKRNTTDLKTQLYHRIIDLAGVRILVYFPDDVVRVVEIIRDSGAFDIWDAAVSFSRGRTDHRKEDKESQLQGSAMDYTGGSFIEMPVSTDDIIRRWKNAGYRAAHLHVTLIRGDRRGEDRTRRSNQPGVRTDGPVQPAPVGNPDVIQTPGNGRSASAQRHGIKARPLAELNFPQDKIVEIQITTVVMHAWSQVEHDIIYKNPYHIPINDSMARMLDGINGLSINSEIMLEELQRTLHKARKDRDGTFFYQNHGLMNALMQEYLEENKNWEAHSQWILVLLMIAAADAINLSSLHYLIRTPAELQNLLEKHNILNRRPDGGEKSDLALTILKELSVEFRERCLDFLKHRRGPFEVVLADVDFSPSIYKWLLTANTYSIMVAIGGQHMIDEFQDRFGDRAKSMRLINAITLGVRVRVEVNTRKELDEFADDFLQIFGSDSHDIAVALANLWLFVDVDPEVPARPISSSKLQEHCEQPQSVVFQPFRQGDNYCVGIETVAESCSNHALVGFDERNFVGLGATDLLNKQLVTFHIQRDGIQSEGMLVLKVFGAWEYVGLLNWMRWSWEDSCKHSLAQ